MFADDVKPRVDPCACCGKLAEVDCWQYRLCYACWKRWHAEVGVPPDTIRWTDASCDGWRTCTAEWLTKARRAAA